MRDTTERNGLEIAIIGMSGRFPGANNIHEFWENLKNGVNSIRFFTEAELLDKNSVDPELIRNPNYVRAKGIIEDVEYFDAFFFGYSPMEAELLDPQIRIFYEVCWEALEDAGCDPSTYPGSIGVYAGGSSNRSWEVLTIISGKQDILGQFTTDTMCDKDFLSTRISHKLDLRGPSVSMHTACSTALVGLDLACRGLLTGQCDAALVGGVSALVDTAKGGGYLYEEGLLRSPDGYVRAFDAKAKGVVFSHGAGAVLLKRLDDAAADGDDIYAVIKGFSANNDGMSKSSFSAPAVDGQARAIRAALYMAEVETESITYVEAHGTGTELGDPIEVEALRVAFDSDKRHYCAIGSLKTNIGHLDVAAGVAGLIKVALMMKHRQIPPSLNFEKPNPKIDFENSPFFVNTELREWENNGCPLRAGVSSFGVGGTNVHVVLEEAPPVEPTSPSRNLQLILLSARTGKALEQTTKNFINYLKENPGIDLADASYTLKVGRKAFEHKRMLVCPDVKEAVEILESVDNDSSDPDGSQRIQTYYEKDEKRAVFMFPGQGSQYVDMAWGLYETESVFHEEMDRCFEIFKQVMGYDLKEILYPSFNRSYRSYRTNINQTEITQPVIFVIEYALAKLLMGWGIEPYAMIGHSIGEYTAACLAGVLTLEDALTIVAWRGKLMQQMPSGSMLSVPLPEAELEQLLTNEEELALAAVNGPSHCVVSGPHEAIDAFVRQLEEKGQQSRRLHTSHAFHSRMMDPILIPFEEKVRGVTLSEPTIPFISNVTGKWLTFQDAVDPNYWSRHLRRAVRFADGVTELLKEKNSIFIEVGPGRTLNTFVRQHPGKESQHMLVNLVRHPKEKISDEYYLMTRIGQIWLYGTPVDWNGFYAGEKRQRLRLPTYPFQRQPYWIDGNPTVMIREGMGRQLVPVKKHNIDNWFYLPSWKRSFMTSSEKSETIGHHNWLVFAGEGDLDSQLVKKLAKMSENGVTVVRAGEAFAKQEEGVYTVAPGQKNDYEMLINALAASGAFPHRVVHLWNLTGESEAAVNRELDSESVEKSIDLGFYSLIYLVQAIRKQNLTDDFQIIVVSNNMQEVTGEESLCPGKSTVLGPVKVIPQEFLNIICRSIDIVFPPSGSWREDKLITQLAEEMSMESTDTIVAYRSNNRWVQTFEAVKLGKNKEFKSPLRKGGVYLVTGGLGGVGLTLAQHLAGTVGARLILTGRSALPPREEWEDWLSTHSNHDGISQKIRKVRKIEETGGEVMAVSADVASLEQMQAVITLAEKRFGPINGVIHAAGIMIGNSSQYAVENISQHECREQFQSKVYGLMVLETVLKDKDLDFCLLTSSLSCVLGGLGFIAYSAANIFMDAFVRKHNSTHSRGWISVNWDGWQLEAKNDPHSPGGESEDVLAMLPGEGVETFQRILDWGEKEQVVVSVSDLQSRIDRWIMLKSLREDNLEVEDSALQGTRPDLTTPYTAPRDQVEQTLAVIWQKFFGFDQVGIGDDFFELGGDSLKAITIIGRIRKEMNVRVPLPEFFKALTVSGLAAYIKKTSEDKEDKYVSIEPVEEKEYYPLSAWQKRMFILNLFMEYNIPLLFVVEGNLDRHLVEDVFQKLVKRHEGLRTSFHTVDGETVQKIHNHVDFKIEYFDFTGLQGEAEVKQRIFRPFDLSQAPLLRVGLLKISENRHMFLVNVHHLVSDGVTLGILSREFIRLCRREELPELETRYRDFSQWQNRLLQGEVYKKQEEYWLNVFSGEIPVLNMALDYPRPAMQSFDGRRIPFTIEGEAFRALKNLAVEEGASMFMVLMAVYNTLLFRYTGQEDIVIGTITAGREQRDVENIVGIFINPLVLRNFPAGSKTFQGFLDQLKQNTLEAHENQLYPFGDLLEKVVKKKDHSRNPLFDVMLIYQNRDIGNLEVEGLRFSGYEPEPEPGHEPDEHAQQDITLWANEEEERIRIDLEYCTALFKQETMERFAGHFLTLLREAAADPGLSLSQIEMVNEKEKRQILTEFNNTKTPFPEGKTIYRLFEEQVEKFPDRIAVIAQNEEGRHAVTYRELNENANQLAQGLRNRDVKPGTIVGIMPKRSIEMFVGIMGILKSGGAYLPIDPQYPEERIQYMLADSDARLLLSGVSELNGVSGKCEVIELKDIAAENEKFPAQLTQPAQLNSTNVAYVIYTSGSTGKPKGVMISHDSFVNASFAWIKEYRLDVIEVNLLQIASFSFDVFSGDMARALLTGGKLVICPEDMRVDFPSLYALVKDHKITLFESTPALIIPFMEYIYENQLDIRQLQLLILGSDICSPEDFKRLMERFMKGNPMRIVNSYGVTEAAIDSSYYEEYLENIPVKGNVPIGKPLPNVELYILDPAGNLQPVGIAGELYIGGKGVALGYLNNPELTTEKFVECHRSYRSYKSYSSYRTGDLARWLSDGNVEFLGRVDYQVKIRGFRVELGEIEARLVEHEDIKEAVVLDKQDESVNKYLCAYIVPAEDEKGQKNDHFTVSDLKTYLFGQLPDYMIPTQFIEIDEIPLTPNGKIDTKALLALEGGIGIGIEYVAPTNEVEKKLVDLWANILDKDRIGIYDNFFDLGGQSLKAMRLMVMIREVFHVKIPLVSFFEVGTVKGIAGLILENQSQKRPVVHPLQPLPQAATDHSISRIKFKKKKRKEVEL